MSDSSSETFTSFVNTLEKLTIDEEEINLRCDKVLPGSEDDFH